MKHRTLIPQYCTIRLLYKVFFLFIIIVKPAHCQTPAIVNISESISPGKLLTLYGGNYKIVVSNKSGLSKQQVYINQAVPRWVSDERAYPGMSFFNQISYNSVSEKSSRFNWVLVLLSLQTLHQLRNRPE